MKQTGGKANPAAVNAAPQDSRLNLPDEGVIRTKCTKCGPAPAFFAFFNSVYGMMILTLVRLRVYLNFLDFGPFSEHPGRVAFQNASTSLLMYGFWGAA